MKYHVTARTSSARRSFYALQVASLCTTGLNPDAISHNDLQCRH